MTCQYSLSVTGILSGCTCCNKHPKAEVGIQLVAQPLENFGIVQKPDNWAPEVLAPTTITFDPSHMYNPVKAQGISMNINIPQPNMQMNVQPQVNMNVQPQVNMNVQPQMNMQMNMNANPMQMGPQGGDVSMNFNVNMNEPLL